MSQEREDTVRLLNRLLRVCHASEQGLIIAAENADNPALKVLFRGFAQERARMAAALRQPIRERGGAPVEGDGLLAAAHWGWINIKAVMTIGPVNVEKVVLAEVLRGERAALYTYESALRSGLEGDLQQIIIDQYDHLRRVHVRLGQLRGDGSTRLLAQLHDGSLSAQGAINTLHAGGVDVKGVEDIPLSQILTDGDEIRQSNMLAETSLAGGLVGAGLGLLLSMVVALSLWLVMGQSLSSLATDWVLLSTALITVAAPTIFGAFLGGIIGAGLMQEDRHRYHHGLKSDQSLRLLRLEGAM